MCLTLNIPHYKLAEETALWQECDALWHDCHYNFKLELTHRQTKIKVITRPRRQLGREAMRLEALSLLEERMRIMNNNRRMEELLEEKHRIEWEREKMKYENFRLSVKGLGEQCLTKRT